MFGSVILLVDLVEGQSYPKATTYRWGLEPKTEKLLEPLRRGLDDISTGVELVEVGLGLLVFETVVGLRGNGRSTHHRLHGTREMRMGQGRCLQLHEQRRSRMEGSRRQEHGRERVLQRIVDERGRWTVQVSRLLCLVMDRISVGVRIVVGRGVGVAVSLCRRNVRTRGLRVGWSNKDVMVVVESRWRSWSLKSGEGAFSNFSLNVGVRRSSMVGDSVYEEFVGVRTGWHVRTWWRYVLTFAVVEWELSGEQIRSSVGTKGTVDCGLFVL